MTRIVFEGEPVSIYSHWALGGSRPTSDVYLQVPLANNAVKLPIVVSPWTDKNFMVTVAGKSAFSMQYVGDLDKRGAKLVLG